MYEDHDYGDHDYDVLFPNGEYRDDYTLSELQAMSAEDLDELSNWLKDAGYHQTVSAPQNIHYFLKELEKRVQSTPHQSSSTDEVEEIAGESMADWMEGLERIGELRDKGLLTEEQFDQQRSRILPSVHLPPESSNQAFHDKHDRNEVPNPKSAKWSLDGLSGFLTASLMLLVIIHVWRIAAHAQRWSLINDLVDGRYVSYSQLDAADSNVINSFGGLVICHFVFLILMIVWAWRATDNLEHWNKKPQWGKGWAIGGWFTPIGLLFIPYQVVRDAWRLASKSTTGINYWWLASFISWWIGLIAFGAAFINQESLDMMQSADIVAIVGICIQIFSALTMIKAIRQISDRHTKAALM